MSAGDWCLLESDPGLFSALIREFGFTGAQVSSSWMPIFRLFSRRETKLLTPVHRCLIIQTLEPSIKESTYLAQNIYRIRKQTVGPTDLRRNIVYSCAVFLEFENQSTD